MIDIVVGAIIVALVGSALAYIIHSGKNGECIGCPDAKNCSAHSHTGNIVSTCGHDCKTCGGCHIETK